MELSHNGTIDFPEFSISEMHLAGKSTSRLTHVRNQQILISQCTGTKQIAKSIEELIPSRSFVARTDFTDCDMLNAMITSALKKLLDKHVRFRRRGSVQEQRAQKYDRFLRGRQIACMICEHFRATRAYEAVQGLSDLSNMLFYKMTTSKISMYDGTKLHYQQVKHLQM